MTLNHKYRSAFLLNVNAKNVTNRIIEKLSKLISTENLFFSKSISDSENIYKAIINKKYRYVFNGGGDGTIINAINILNEISKIEKKKQLPKIGILKLGTGNALAKIAKSRHIILDTIDIVEGQKNIEEYSISLIECDNGTLTPFAGIGYDGEILNDYLRMKNTYKMKSIPAYLCAAFLVTLPKQVFSSTPIIRIYTNSDAYKLLYKNKNDQQVKIPNNTLIYEGPSAFVSIGSIPWYGFGLEMFPFTYHKKDFLNLRISNMRIAAVIANLYPEIWNGIYRNLKLQDFLIKDITIESDRLIPYQIGGDFSGLKYKLRFKIANHSIEMARIVPW